MRKVSVRQRQWILSELPLLEREGVLDPQARQRLESYYRIQASNRSNWAMIVCAALAAMLIGGGIILLFAHNWDMLSRTTRAVLSFCPLLIGSVLSWFAMRGNKRAFMESAGLFHALSVGASIALIGQTYHLPSNTQAFLLTWALLVLPLVFLLRSTGCYLIYLALICGWSGVAQEEMGQAIGFWALLLPAILRIIEIGRRDRHSPETLISLWGLMIMLPIALGIVLERTMPGLWIIAYTSLFSLSGLLGMRLYPDQSGWSNPMRSIGLLGATVLVYILTWQATWFDIGWQHTRSAWRYQDWGIWHDSTTAMLLLISWAVCAVRSCKRSSLPSIILSSLPVLAVLGFALSTSGADLLSTLLFNLFMLTLGLAYLIQGCRLTTLRQVNFGMGLISLLVITRFFDSDFGFLARGIAFILIGCGFLAANLIITRKKHPVETPKQ